MTNCQKKSYKKITLVFICLALVFSLFSCGAEYKNKDEILAIERFMKYTEDPDYLIINTLRKYVVSENEIFYYMEWQDGKEEEKEVYKLLVVYNPTTALIKLRHFNDMEQGLYSSVKSKWDEIKDKPDKTFSAEEISEIREIALEIKKGK